jgi:hypothetical protein
VNWVRSNILIAQKAIKGPKVGALIDADDPPSNTPLRQHTNHIFRIAEDGADAPTFLSGEDRKVVDDLRNSGTSVYTGFPTTDIAPTWTYPELNYYVWTNTPADVFYQTTSQQALNNDPSDTYQAWTPQMERLQSAPRTATVNPWPGVSGTIMTFVGGENLSVPSSTPCNTFQQTNLTTSPLVSLNFYFLKKTT